MESHRPRVDDVIIRALLGDGCIVKPKKGNLYFRFKQSTIHADYLFFMYFILEPWITKGSPSLSTSADK